jgi:hypothetical protein
MFMDPESLSTGRAGVGEECDVAGTDVWIGNEVVVGSVAETDVLCSSQAERTEMNVVIANRLLVSF